MGVEDREGGGGPRRLCRRVRCSLSWGGGRYSKGTAREGRVRKGRTEARARHACLQQRGPPRTRANTHTHTHTLSLSHFSHFSLPLSLTLTREQRDHAAADAHQDRGHARRPPPRADRGQERGHHVRARKGRDDAGDTHLAHLRACRGRGAGGERGTRGLGATRRSSRPARLAGAPVWSEPRAALLTPAPPFQGLALRTSTPVEMPSRAQKDTM